MFPFISTESMEWDTSVVIDEPVSIADFIVEEIVSSDDSITSESTYSSDERSERSAAENDVDTDESPNPTEESDDAAENVSIVNPFEDEEIKNFLAVEIRDIHAMLDAISNELSDAEDKEFLEMQAMVLGDYTEEELEESDSEMQAMVLGDYTEEELEESDSGYGIYQAADIDVSDVVPISGLCTQKSAQEKIQEWFLKMV